ncbi:ribosome bioproteinsis protein ytm1 [Xanthoria parietina]
METEQVNPQMRVQLSTSQLDIVLPERNRSILVNTNLRRYGLSSLVNTLLGNEKPIPFDFLINGIFLRSSLDDYLTQHAISSETTLKLEYVKAAIPPIHLASFEHGDWVSSVDVLSTTSPAQRWSNSGGQIPGHERILSASYDGLLRVWNISSQITATSPSAGDGGHLSSIKAAKFVSPSRIASSGTDRTVRLWKYEEASDDSPAVMSQQIELYGHKASVDSIAVHQPSSRLLSASADHTVCLWSTRKSDAPAAPHSSLPVNSSRGAKRRKIGPAISTSQRGYLSSLKSHTAPVSSVIFAPNDPTVAYSTSWDHGLKTWDLPTSTPVDTRSTSHALLSLAAIPYLKLVAAGTSARHITLIDPRASATNVVAMTLRGHTNAVVSLATDPNNTFGLASGSHDGTCRIWDVRSTKTDKEGRVGQSMYSVGRESIGGVSRTSGDGVKVFGVLWDSDIGIVSAGEDKRVQINRGKGAGPITQ